MLSVRSAFASTADSASKADAPARKSQAARVTRAGLAGAVLSGCLLAPVGVANAEDASSGFYVGGAFGFNQTEGETGVRLTSGSATTDFDTSGNGASGGLFVGYAAAFDRMILGVELAWDFNGASGKEIKSSGETVELEHGPSYGGDVRLGYMATDRALTYTRFGVRNASYDFSGSAGGNSYSSEETTMAYKFGAGVDYFVNPNLFLRAEYNYTMFDDESVDFTLGGTDYTYESSPTQHHGLVGIGFKF